MPLGHAECNDMTVALDGTVYVSDTAQPCILRWKPGATTLETWLTDPRFDHQGSDADGIALGGGG